MQRKRPRLSIIILTLVLAVGAFVLTWAAMGSLGKADTGTNPESFPADQAPQARQTIKLPIAVAAQFKDPRHSIIPGEIDAGKIFLDQELGGVIATNEERQKLLEVLGLANVRAGELQLTERNGFNTKPAGSLLITNFTQVDYQLKLPVWAGKSPYALEDYPWLFETERTTSQEGARAELEPEGLKRIFFSGEIIPVRAVDRLFLNTFNNYTFLYDRFRSQIETADLAVALLENPLSGDPKPCTGCTTFVGDARNAKGMAEVGFDVLGFGNHAGDGGLKAIQDTEKLLAEAGIDFTGVSGTNLAGAQKLVVKEVGGKKFGFLSFDDVAWFYFASNSRWGTNHFTTAASRARQIDSAEIKRVIPAMKAQVDYLIAYPSWGTEYTNKANAQQVELAHQLIDNGVDMIMGSHPHWVQNFESYKGKPIFYSLGNFIFDQTHTTETRQGIVVNTYYYQGKLHSFEVIPHLNCGYHQGGTNLAGKVINRELGYEQVDATPERQGCVYWQPKPLDQSRKEYQDTWARFTAATKLE